MKKQIAKLLYNCIAKHLPISHSSFNIGQKKIRYLLAKIICKNIGTNVNIEKGATLLYSLSIGDNSGLGINCSMGGRVSIGNDVLLGPDVKLITVNHAFRDKNKTILSQGTIPFQEIVIEDDVWVGNGAMILPGVRLHKGCVIGAGAVVAKDIPEYAIAVGNPVKIIGYRQ